MQVISRPTSFSARHASAQAVQVSTQAKQASMQRLMASAWLGCSGCERNMVLTATVDMNTFPFQTRRRTTLFRAVGSLSAESSRSSAFAEKFPQPPDPLTEFMSWRS
jgi:hypothetical protein